MFLIDWYERLSLIRLQIKERKLSIERQFKLDEKEIVDTEYERLEEFRICQSCETLKMQLALANQEKTDLLNRILSTPIQEDIKNTQDIKAVLPNRHLSFNMRRQILEREDRERAKLIKKNDMSTKSNELNQTTNIDDLERELEIVTETRMNQKGTNDAAI